MYFAQCILATTKESFSMCILMNTYWHWTQDSEVHLSPLFLSSSLPSLQQFIRLGKQ